jgi:hypothetical protein
VKRLFLLLFILISLNSYSQTYRELLDSAKKEFRHQFYEYTPDYSISHALLKRLVQMDSTNEEARYFFGYVLDKMSMLHGMDSIDRILSLASSLQFEALNRLQPAYSGEMMLLDPYSKLTAIWGSRAMAFLNHGKIDSVKWAFAEGKRRGGFNDGILECNRQVLQSCKPNSIFVLVGDNSTFPSYYLQIMENFRKDIVLVDKNMLESLWYPQLLKKEGRLKFTLTSIELDSLNAIPWKPTSMQLQTMDGSSIISWDLKPTYFEYLLRADRVLLQMLQNNFKEDNLCFMSPVDSSMDLFLDEYLSFEGAVHQLRTTKVNYLIDPLPLTSIMNYTAANISVEIIRNSRDVHRMVTSLMLIGCQAVQVLASQQKNDEAKRLFNQISTNFPLDKVPFLDDESKNYYQLTKEYLK